MRTSLRATIVLVAALLVTGGCRPGGDPQGQLSFPASPTDSDDGPATPPTVDPGGGSLRFALGSDPAAIDPLLVADAEGRVVVDALFDSLVRLDEELTVQPAAAASWELNEEATRFTFQLVEGATFHDGTPVTARDFVRAFNRIVSDATAAGAAVASQLAPVAGFEAARADGVPLSGLQAVDDRTLVIELRQPFAEFAEVLAHPSLAPVPPAAETSPASFAEQPVGNGPFQMAEAWQHNQYIRVARYDAHPSGGPRLDEVVFQIYADDPLLEAQYGDLEQGQLHFAEVPVSKLTQAVEQFGISDDGYTGPGVLDGVAHTLYYYGFDTTEPPFDDPDVRRAISHLIDRERIVDVVVRDSRTVATSIVPPPFPGSQEDPCGSCTFDPERAVELIGDRELETLRIVHNAGRTHAAIADIVARAIEQHLDVEVEVESRDLLAHVQALRAGEMQIFRLGWEATYPSPGSFLLPLFHSSRVGSDNLTGFSDPTIDELLGEARGEPEVGRRWELYQDAERRILDQVPLAPVLFYEHNRVVAPNVRDLVYTAMGTVDLAQVWLAERR